jgi:hypothetical protein
MTDDDLDRALKQAKDEVIAAALAWTDDSVCPDTLFEAARALRVLLGSPDPGRVPGPN